MSEIELTGAELDYRVAKAEGHEVDPPLAAGQAWPAREALGRKYEPNYIRFSTEWAAGGPIIERERIEISFMGDGHGWQAAVNPLAAADYCIKWVDGPTPLIAAMRAYVEAKTRE